MYANEIASLLDPSGRLFAGRIISANDSSAMHRKGLDVVMASEALTLIVDDTEPVWRDCAANVIVVGGHGCLWLLWGLKGTGSAVAAAALAWCHTAALVGGHGCL